MIITFLPDPPTRAYPWGCLATHRQLCSIAVYVHARSRYAPLTCSPSPHDEARFTPSKLVAESSKGL